MKAINSLMKRVASLRSFPAVITYQGCRFVLDRDNWIDRRLLAGIGFEPNQIQAAVGLAREMSASRFLDIGANFGLYTAIMGQQPTVKHTHSFEPVKRNLAQLHATVFANRIWDKAQILPYALSDHDGEQEIFIDPTSTGVSRLDLASAGRDSTVFRQTETVQVRALDSLPDFARITGERCFIKIDVEGHAPAVLRGMKSFLSKNICGLQIELSSEEIGASMSIMDGLSYRCDKQIDSDHYFQPR